MGLLGDVIQAGASGAGQAFNQLFGQGGSGANGWTPGGSIPVGGVNLVQAWPGYWQPPPNPNEAPGQGPSAYNDYNPFANGPGAFTPGTMPQVQGPNPTYSQNPVFRRPPTIHTLPYTQPTPQGHWGGGFGTGPFGQRWVGGGSPTQPPPTMSALGGPSGMMGAQF